MGTSPTTKALFAKNAGLVASALILLVATLYVIAAMPTDAVREQILNAFKHEVLNGQCGSPN